jgi:WD40 repeat protein
MWHRGKSSGSLILHRHKYDATWSPDGRWIAVAANSDGTVQIWKVPANLGQEQRLTSGCERMRHLFYSPDGRWLYVQPSHRNIHQVSLTVNRRRPRAICPHFIGRA